MLDYEKSVMLSLIRKFQRLSEQPPLDSNRGTKREKSASEPVQRYQKPGHGLFFCLHERSYFVECRNCKRTRSEAEANEQEFLDKMDSTQRAT
jgi:hypothetical protein